MIQKIAKAILDSMDLTDGLNISSATVYAEAALNAMLEPTEELKKFETDEGLFDWSCNCYYCGGHKFAVQSYIKQALK